MATLDLIDIVGNDPSNTLVSAYLTSNNNFAPADGTLLESVSHPTNSDSGGNNFHLQFTLSATQTSAFQSGQDYITVYNNSSTGNDTEQVIFNNNGFYLAAGSFAGDTPSLTQTTYNTTGPTGATGMNGTNGTNGATGATGPAGMNGINGATGAQGPQGVMGTTGATGPQGAAGPQGVAGATGATGPMGSIGATGPAGATGPQGVPGPAGTNRSAANAGIETVTATQNADGTTTYKFTGGSYFDGKSYSAVTDTRDASSVNLLTEIRDKNNGSHAVSVYQGGQTVTSNFFDTLNNGGAPDTTFVFNPGFGRDVVSLFRVDGADHDTLSFKGSDYSNSIATVLNSARDTSAGLLITDPTASSPGGGPGTHDTLLLEGITKQQLAQNQADITFHA